MSLNEADTFRLYVTPRLRDAGGEDPPHPIAEQHSLICSLRQGIEDGFLAPYRVHRVITDVDATGWRPRKDEVAAISRAYADNQPGLDALLPAVLDQALKGEL